MAWSPASAITVTSGAGSPEGVISKPVGWLYLRTNGAAGTVLYVKESGTGNTGWVAYSSSGGGGGSAVWTEIELDFGATPVADKVFTITDATVTATSKIAVVGSAKIPTSGTGDEGLFDIVVYTAKPAAGSFTIYAMALPGPIQNNRNVLYQVST